MKLIFAGTPEFAATALATLINTQHDIVAVYTQPDRPSGRGQKLSASPVKQLALQHGLTVLQPENFKSSSDEGIKAQQQLADFQADVMVVAAYGLILPQVVLDTPKYGCLNIHASLLPRWRGAAPIQRAILAGDQQSGVTIMQMAKGLDTGDMLYKVSCDITATDTASTLHDKLTQLGAEAIGEVLEDEQHLQHYQANRVIQNEALSNYAHKIVKAEAKIDWAQPAQYLDLHIRAFNPVPVAFCLVAEGSPLRIWSAEPAKETHTSKYGEILAVDKQGVLVACGAGTTLRLTSLQWAGGKALNAVQVFQTQKLQVGQILL
ncbi:methionyl-tRNA formyltransferase [Acinetobacter puyangensis]|uniref:Methionyl-tRNA formyltransferase n=1 Tax=Acinetobacter puyangensis TaxID=1096779 RepID=A0A240EES7_9GAMM|nr:methionyl-tRNA formyltransferase [Acinetobacter puyangensis]SNX46430.1 methionyl-tRNA formyltransferase [Acinetobacter puyangensis]